MAIDSPEKRASLISWSRPGLPMPPLPDGEVNTNDRYQLVWLYRLLSDQAPFVIICPPRVNIDSSTDETKIFDSIPLASVIENNIKTKIYSNSLIVSIVSLDPDFYVGVCL